MNKYELDRNRIKDVPEHQKTCEHPDHWPSREKREMLPPGQHLHECPHCMKRTYFMVYE